MPIKKEGVIYGIRHLAETGFCYVGQTRGRVQERWRGHKKGATPISRALQMFGPENFEMLVIERVAVEQLNAREVHWIREYDTLAPNGLNCIEGGHSSARSAPTCERMGAARKKLWADPEYHAKVKTALQHSWTDERKARASEIMKARMNEPDVKAKMAGRGKGRVASAATRAKIVAAVGAYWAQEGSREKQSEATRGRRHSEATRAKMAAAHRARVAAFTDADRAACSANANRRWDRVRAGQGVFA